MGRRRGSARAKANKKDQRKRQQEPTSGVFRLTKASEKWYNTTQNKQGKFVHVVSVYKKNSPNYAAAIAQNIRLCCNLTPTQLKRKP